MLSIVLVTCPKDSAGEVAKAVLDQRLAACVNIVETVQSRYWWRGKLEAVDESLLLIKTKMELFPALERAVKHVHPYKVPEIVALHVDRASRRYLDWALKEVAQTHSRPARRRGENALRRGRG